MSSDLSHDNPLLNTQTVANHLIISSFDEYEALDIPEGAKIQAQIHITPKRRAQSNEPSKRTRVKRVRIDDSSSSTNQSNPCALLRYSFLIPIVLEYLTDADVLLRLLLTGKVMKPSLLNYHVKQWIIQSQVMTMTKRSQRRYLPITVVNMRNITKLDLSHFTTIKQIEIILGPKAVTSIKPGMLPEWLTGVEFNYKKIKNDPTNPPSYYELEEGLFPCRLKRLTLDDYFNHPVVTGALPETLEELEFGKLFDQHLEADTLPKSLKKLKFGENFNQHILPDVLPVSLTSLSFGWRFNQKFEPGCLPPSLQELHPGAGFNQPLEIGAFSLSLRSLQFWGRFNQTIDPGVIPHGVTSLTLGIDFNQPLVPGTLPDTLETLKLSGHFNQPIAGVIPKRLKNLVMQYPGAFNQSLESALPDTLIKLRLGDQFNQPIEPGTLPSSLLRLSFDRKFNQPLKLGSLPPHLTHLDMGRDFCHSLHPGVIPESVVDLKLSPALAPLLEWSSIPRKVVTLRVVHKHDRPLVPGDIPITVNHLILTVNKASLLQPGSIPNSVTDLALRVLDDDLPAAGVIPLSVTHLSLSDICKKMGKNQISRRLDLTSFIAKSVTHLRFEWVPVEVTIPTGITHLSYQNCFYRRVDMSEIPTTVVSLSLKWTRGQPFTVMNMCLEKTSADEAVVATLKGAEVSFWTQWEKVHPDDVKEAAWRSFASIYLPET